MRAVIVIVLLALVLSLIGWVKFSSPDGDPTIRVDSDKVKQDTSELVDKTKQAVDEAAAKLDDSIHSDSGNANDSDDVQEVEVETVKVAP